ncbi:MAG: hypothetical protein DME25_19425 [Verrucomicrobia bacterium]|nr:MAG: hypothetical protein DME25_19425 [Verrucomicrobiota bacterium]
MNRGGLGSLPQSALACAACFGQSDDSMARGMNLGIFALLLVTAVVLVGFASFGVFLARRSARFAAAAASPPAPAQSPADAARPISQPTP